MGSYAKYGELVETKANYAQYGEQVTQPTPVDDNNSFLKKLAMSESSNNPQAEIQIKDGRKFAGLYQFGSARLADFKRASGERFTMKQFKNDPNLQNRVVTWHIADIDKAIDALGNVARNYDRDGLRAVAHLGGKGGMRKYVKSRGKYNPSDELGTSLNDYYKKFSK